MPSNYDQSRRRRLHTAHHAQRQVNFDEVKQHQATPPCFPASSQSAVRSDSQPGGPFWRTLRAIRCSYKETRELRSHEGRFRHLPQTRKVRFHHNNPQIRFQDAARELKSVTIDSHAHHATDLLKRERLTVSGEFDGYRLVALVITRGNGELGHRLSHRRTTAIGLQRA